MLIISIITMLCCAQSTQDTTQQLVDSLNLESYKTTLKTLTTFGDRRQGTARNRAACGWIEEQVSSYGYTNS
ncbi:MAG: peptidase M28, partial [Planctomycetota bacterium]|nr:peptidase M28 [Planctomycetota bacterium]